MIFLIGFPKVFYAAVLKDVLGSIQGEQITGLPFSNSNVFSEDYINECFETLVAFRKGRPKCFDKGLVFVSLAQFSTSGISSFADLFFPFSIIREVRLTHRLSFSGSQMARDKNEILRLTIAEVKKSIKIRNQITTHLESRCNRTPLLLPINHFGEEALTRLLWDAWSYTRAHENIPTFFNSFEKTFESEFPFSKKKGSAGFFSNAKDVEFRSPGRDLHGAAHLDDPNHIDRCFLNAYLRVGGQIRAGFHYDCTRDGNKHSGKFVNCHGSEVVKTGRPHLNVYPNDFIR